MGLACGFLACRGDLKSIRRNQYHNRGLSLGVCLSVQASPMMVAYQFFIEKYLSLNFIYLYYNGERSCYDLHELVVICYLRFSLFVYYQTFDIRCINRRSHG